MARLARSDLLLVVYAAAVAVAGAGRAMIDGLEAEHPRHAFPSGHVAVAAVVGYLLIRHRLGLWTAVGVPICVGIDLSTLYLHLSDVLAGLALAAGSILIARAGPPTIPVSHGPTGLHSELRLPDERARQRAHHGEAPAGGLRADG